MMLTYCLTSLLWSAIFFALGYLTALAAEAIRQSREGHHR